MSLLPSNKERDNYSANDADDRDDSDDDEDDEEDADDDFIVSCCYFSTM